MCAPPKKPSGAAPSSSALPRTDCGRVQLVEEQDRSRRMAPLNCGLGIDERPLNHRASTGPRAESGGLRAMRSSTSVDAAAGAVRRIAPAGARGRTVDAGGRVRRFDEHMRNHLATAELPLAAGRVRRAHSLTARAPAAFAAALIAAEGVYAETVPASGPVHHVDGRLSSRRASTNLLEASFREGCIVEPHHSRSAEETAAISAHVACTRALATAATEQKEYSRP